MRSKFVTWKRGFFRLWLVLSALWIVACVSVTGPDTYRWWPNKLIKLNIAGHEVEVDETFLKLTHEEQNQEIDKIAKSLHIKEPNYFDKYDPPGNLPPPGYAFDHPFNWTVWSATFIPPLAMLLLGICIAWILSGFRARRS